MVTIDNLKVSGYTMYVVCPGFACQKGEYISLGTCPTPDANDLKPHTDRGIAEVTWYNKLVNTSLYKSNVSKLFCYFARLKIPLQNTFEILFHWKLIWTSNDY